MKKVNEKGFTLIELLAIIVIIAIIAVITVPIILNVVAGARKGAAHSSVIGYAKAIELAYVTDLYGGTTSTNGTNTTVTIDTVQSTLLIDYSGNDVSCTDVIISGGHLTMNGCEVDGVSGTFNYSEGTVTDAS